jgi:hypothetical protein
MKTKWDIPESPANSYSVDEERWERWPNVSKVLFNEVLDATPGYPDDIWDLGWHIAMKVANDLARMLEDK